MGSVPVPVVEGTEVGLATNELPRLDWKMHILGLTTESSHPIYVLLCSPKGQEKRALRSH